MTDMSVMSITSMFLIGLLGAGHCVGMCGGIVAVLGFATDSNQPRWPIILTYNLGRISSYGLMGGRWITWPIWRSIFIIRPLAKGSCGFVINSYGILPC
jgi:sulfite exporter TauE/SafE